MKSFVGDKWGKQQIIKRKIIYKIERLYKLKVAYSFYFALCVVLILQVRVEHRWIYLIAVTIENIDVTLKF